MDKPSPTSVSERIQESSLKGAMSWNFATPPRYDIHFQHRFGMSGGFLSASEPKPSQSYIGLIGTAILGSPEQKLVLSDIYQWVLDRYPYFRSRGPGWRNSIRHNLSLNDCFVKSGRSATGKGHFWTVHPANVHDFANGDFRRRRAQRKVRKHMGLSVDSEEEDSDCVRRSPLPLPPVFVELDRPRRRGFDMESILAPEPQTFQAEESKHMTAFFNSGFLPQPLNAMAFPSYFQTLPEML